MGCCMSRDPNKGIDHHSNKANIIKTEEVPINTKSINFVNDDKDDEDLDETQNKSFNKKNRSIINDVSKDDSKVDINRSNYEKPNLSPISINDENNFSDNPLKMKKESYLEIILNIVSFDLICSPGNYFNNFYSDFNPELLLTFEEKIENFLHEKNQEIEVDDDYLNKSGQFEQGLLGSSKRKNSLSSFSSVSNTNMSYNNRSSSPTNKNTVPTSFGDKKIKQFLFENNIFKISDLLIDKMTNLEKNSYINFALFQKNRRDENNRFIIGEGFFPVHFLYTQLDNEIIRIPIYNHIEDLFLGNLILKVQTSMIIADLKDKERKENFKLNKSIYLNLLNDYLKYQNLNLYDYSKLLKKPFSTDKEISQFDYNLMKIDLHNIIQKYIKASNEKEEVLKELYQFFFEFVDAGNSSCIIDDQFNTQSSSKEREKKRFRLDFKTVNQTKYFIFLSILNEILINCDPQDQNFNLLKSSKFLNEKIIFSPYENYKNENKNYVLVESAITLLLNIRKNTSSPMDPRFLMDNLLPFFGNYYKKAATHVFTILEKSGIKMSTVNNEDSFKSFGPVSNESYLVFRNIMYKFLKLVKMSIDVKNENLEAIIQQKESNQKKIDDLIDESCKDVEGIKRNFYYYFLCTKESLTGKDKKPVEKDLLYIKDINYTVGIINILNSFVKICKNIAKISRSSPVDIYIDKLLSENSDFLKFISTALKIFYKNCKFLNILLTLMYEIISDAYGIYLFNFFKSVDINLIFKSFNTDAKYLDSRKFNTWNSLFIIVFKCCKLIKKSEMEAIDFLNLKWLPIYNQITSLYVILNKNHYFKLADQIDLEFEKKSHLIFVKTSKSKFLTNKISVRIQNKFFEIFNDFTYKENLIFCTIQRNDKLFYKIFSRIVYLVLMKVEGPLNEIFTNNTEHLFKTYINIMNILINLKSFLRVDINNEIITTLAYIFPNTPSVLEIFKYDKFLEILGTKIKSLAPSKFDFKTVVKTIDKLKQ